MPKFDNEFNAVSFGVSSAFRLRVKEVRIKPSRKSFRGEHDRREVVQTDPIGVFLRENGLRSKGIRRGG